MFRLQKDEILDRLIFSEGVATACAKTESTHFEPSGDHWPRPILLERAAYLRKLARFSEGFASETIRDYGCYRVALTVFLRSGDPVIHATYADTLTVLDGHATLLTGGTLKHPTRVDPEEIRGTAIQGGTSRELRTGDLIHLPAGMRYQFLLAGEKALSCLIVSVREIDGAR
jgi:hypothetical protein